MPGVVDRQLFGDRQVHGQVQERVGAAGLDAIVGLGGLGVLEVAVVFGVFQDPVQRGRFQRRQDFAGAMLAPGLGEELADLVSGRVEHHPDIVPAGPAAGGARPHGIGPPNTG